VYGPHWQEEYTRVIVESREWIPHAGATPDVQALPKVMIRRWDILCRPQLDWRKRDLAYYLLRVRNDCMHQQPFSFDDAYRAIDGIETMLAAIAVPQRREMRALKEMLRNAQATSAPLSSTNTTRSAGDRHLRLRWWLGPMADDLLADVPYPRRALRVARWSAVGILCFILATLAFSTPPPEALPSVLVMTTIDVALLYLLTRGLTWGERWC